MLGDSCDRRAISHLKCQTNRMEESHRGHTLRPDHDGPQISGICASRTQRSTSGHPSDPIMMQSRARSSLRQFVSYPSQANRRHMTESMRAASKVTDMDPSLGVNLGK